jgi:hypothetical protein
MQNERRTAAVPANGQAFPAEIQRGNGSFESPELFLPARMC